MSHHPDSMLKKNTEKILVTGATGFIGSHLVLELLKRGYSVRALYRSEKSKRKLENLFRLYKKSRLIDSVEWFHGDILCTTSIEEALDGISRVFHTAAIVSFDRRRAEEMLQINRVGTANLVNLSLQSDIKHFIHFSSIAALGGNLNRHTEEDIWSWTKPHTVYAASKFAGEMEVWRGMQEGLQAAILNPSVVAGPGFWNTGFGLTVRKVIQKKWPFYTTGVTGYVDVRDTVQIALALMEKQISGERFIVSEGNYSFREILHGIARHAQVKPPRHKLSPLTLRTALPLMNAHAMLIGKGFMPDKNLIKTLFDRDYYDNRKTKTTLEFQYTPIEQTLAFTVKKYFENLLINQSENKIST